MTKNSFVAEVTFNVVVETYHSDELAMFHYDAVGSDKKMVVTMLSRRSLAGWGFTYCQLNYDDINLIIDILIAGDFYWSFFFGNIQKGRTGPIAFRNNIRVSIER